MAKNNRATDTTILSQVFFKDLTTITETYIAKYLCVSVTYADKSGFTFRM